MMNLYGYSQDGMLPLTLPRALELYDQDMPVYLLHEDNSEALAFDRSEIEIHAGIFGMERDVWERSLAYKEMSAANSEAARESAFINGNADTYAVYQLKDGDELRYHRFTPLDMLKTDNLTVDRGNYNLVYTAPLPPADTLDDIFRKLNTDRPADFTGHSLSVSDVVALNRGGEITSHYVDNTDFVELADFLGVEKQQEKTVVPEAGERPMAKPIVEKRLSEMLGLNLEDNKSQPPVSEKAPEKANISKTVYAQTLAYAREHGELDKYNESRNLNTECRDAIHTAINEARYDTNHYHMKDAVKDVVDKYGAERVELLMAKVIQGADWDGRYSRQNKEWAKGFEIPHGMKDVYSNTHPCLLDGFTDRFREAAAVPEKKPSILEALKQGAEKSRQHETPKPETKKNMGVEI